MALVTGWGKTPVACHDTPGFIVNRVNRPFTIAALRLLETRAASVAVIDRALRDAGFPMGPFELMDLIGLDVNLAAATAVWEGLGRPGAPAAVGHPGPAGAGRPPRAQDRRGLLSLRGRPGGRAGRATSPMGRRRPLQEAAIAGLVINAIDDEARRAVADGVAEPDAIDLALRLGANHPVGPFERRSVTRLRGSTAGS